MSSRRVRCPGCAVVLGVPQGFRGCNVLCSRCKSKFRIPGISDAEIVDLIGNRSKDDSTVAGESVEAISAALSKELGSILQETTAGQGRTREFRKLPADLENLRLVRVDFHGVLLEFPGSLLENKRFRGAMPRRCLRCGSKNYLRPHLIVYSHHMADSSKLETEFVDSTAIMRGHDAMKLPGEELLDKLPAVKRVPAPANLPMPYWICKQCNPSKMIAAQNKIDSSTGLGSCRLQIRRYWRAEEFIIAMGAENTAIHEEIRQALKKYPEDPWNMLAGVVQQRLRQWYQPHNEERFMAYTPDRSHGRSEDGVTGIVVSNRRIICNCDRRFHESQKGEPIELSVSMSEKQMRLSLTTPNWNIRNLVVDKVGLERLRRALAKQKFIATWH